MRAAALAAVLLAAACGTPSSTPVGKEVVVWEKLGEWSGRGNSQTETFLGLTGSLRIHWKTKAESPGGGGRLRLILSSAISGRDLMAPVDVTGVGEGTVYAAEDPRVFHFVVESENVDWWFTVEEASFGTESPER